MVTKLGKLLVLLNAFAAVTILSWAVSAYLNRQDPDQAVDERGEKLTDKVKRLNGELAVAQTAFGPAYAAVSDGEAKLADYRAKITARLQESQGGVFYNIYDVAQQQGADPADPKAVAPIRKILWGQLPQGRIVQGAGGPLKGVKAVQDEIQDELAKIDAFGKSITVSVKGIDDLNTEILALIDKTTRLKGILTAHETEIPALTDDRFNWEDRIATLTKRNRQLQARLTDLTGTRVGSAVSSVIPPAFTPGPAK